MRVAGRWLPWVSNANADWMVSVQEKYDLGGTLDTKSTYAGNKGQNIDGVEIHIFEESDTSGGTITPVGKYNDDIFNIKCGVLTWIFEAVSTLGYKYDSHNYSNDQIAMPFIKYNSLANAPNEYGKSCANWYQIFHKYNLK